MTTAGEGVVGRGIEIAGEAVVGGAAADTGVVIVPGGPSGVTRQELEALGDAVAAVAGNVGGALTAIGALANRPREYAHVQTTGSDVWHVPHHLGFRPTFTAYLNDGTPIAHAGVTHPIPGEVMEVHWGAPFTGYGYAS